MEDNGRTTPVGYPKCTKKELTDSRDSALGCIKAVTTCKGDTKDSRGSKLALEEGSKLQVSCCS